MADEKVCIAGMGYVGLTLSIVLSESGCDVLGVDINEEVVGQLSTLNTSARGDAMEGVSMLTLQIPPRSRLGFFRSEKQLLVNYLPKFNYKMPEYF